MNAYAELIQKIMKLNGWEWEWRFGDRGYDPILNDEFVVTFVDRERDVLAVSFGDGGHRTIDRDQAIPLPTVEQWMEKFDKAGCELSIFIGCSNMPGLRHHITVIDRDYKTTDVWCPDVLDGLAELYARVVLDYRYEDGEFVR